MLAEISLLVGGLKALNEGIAIVKESGSNLTGLANVFGTLTESKVAVEKIEAAAEDGDHVLTQEEALELAWAKNEIREKEKELKKVTPRMVWRDMLTIQHKSLMEHKHKTERERLARNRAITKRSELIKNIAGGVLLTTVGLAVVFFVPIF
jgi:hypothetical protein